MLYLPHTHTNTQTEKSVFIKFKLETQGIPCGGIMDLKKDVSI